MADSKKAGDFFTYKGRPLVRCGDEIYYGNMEEPYVIRLQIKSKKEVNGEEIAEDRSVKLTSVVRADQIVFMLPEAAVSVPMNQP